MVLAVAIPIGGVYADSAECASRIAGYDSIGLSENDRALTRTAAELADSGFCDEALRILLAVSAPDDSAALAGKFVALRATVMRMDLDETARSIVRTAEELAASGLYSEALDILNETVSPLETLFASARDTAARRVTASRLPQWRIRAFGDYNHNEERDTADTLDSLFLLSGGDTSEYSAGVDASWHLSSDSSTIRRAEARVSLTSYEAVAGGGADLRLFWNYLEAGTNAECRSYLFRTYGDSSDNVRLAVNIAPTTRPANAGAWFSAPVFAELTRYRFSRSDYANSERYRATPTLSWNLADRTIRCAVSAAIEHLHYSPPDSRLNRTSYGPALSFEISSGGMSALIDGRLSWDRFAQNDEPSSPDNQRVLELRPDLSYLAIDGLELRTSAAIRFSTATYSDTFYQFLDTLYYYSPLGILLRPQRLSYSISVPALTITPAAVVTVADLIDCAVEFTYDMNHVPVKHEVNGLPLADGIIYIDDWYDAFEPLLGISCDRTWWNAGLEARFRYENMKERHSPVPTYLAGSQADPVEFAGELFNYLEDSRTVSGDAHAEVTVCSWLSIQAAGRIELIWYAPFYADGRVSRNFSASLSIETRF